MRRITFVWILVLLLFVSTAFGQISMTNNLPNKDLIFPQVAAGGEYETWITVVNRGTQTWNGLFEFYRAQGTAWNPYVNGSQVSNGALPVSIAAKSTRTFKVTLPGAVDAGFLMATADDLDLDNFLEGNLTYADFC